MKYFYLFLAALGATLITQTINGQLAAANLYLFVWGSVLAYHDIKTQSYPFWLWLAGTALLLPFVGLNATTLILLGLAILAEVKNINIGSGDFFYLSTLALILPLTELLWVIQIGSLLGIIFIWRQEQSRQAIPFVPFLWLAHLVVIQFQVFT